MLDVCQPKPAGKILETITSAVNEKRPPIPACGTSDDVVGLESSSRRGALTWSSAACAFGAWAEGGDVI